MSPLWAHENQELAAHLSGVAQRAAEFGKGFGATEQARLAGLLHDLGKAEDEFQKRIRSDDKEGEKRPHAHHGAALALRNYAWPVAFAINAHHAGLHNRADLDSKCSTYRDRAEDCLRKLTDDDPAWQRPEPAPPLPAWLPSAQFDQMHRGEVWSAAELFTRFLFSALVDADRLDTEANAKGLAEAAAARSWPDFDPVTLLAKLDQELGNRSRRAGEEHTASEQVLSVRHEVGRLCRESASQPRGLFSLTVPTGGGKTLASMLFALAHAAHHNARLESGQRPLRRVIVVIPFLSIIQQTVGELKGIFGEDMVLEHHSQADETDRKLKKGEDEDGRYDERSERRRLAAENWDAPLIVTTSVQFFGSLFSRRPSAARKLHNICQSIVIFDEVQTLPPLLLQPILSVLAELASPERPYGCSLVFCTATQPALGRSDDLPCGLRDITPIIPQEVATGHFHVLKRVDYQWPEDGEKLSWVQLAQQVASGAQRQTLIVVNTRRAARELFNEIAVRLGDDRDGLFHLSTWMTPVHRLQVLDEVKNRLAERRRGGTVRRCILVSTQCIEAGVDVDFPEVWRAFGPYDSIVQAAGRCNRNGLDAGVVHVFSPEEELMPPGLYRTAASQTELLRKMKRANPDDPASFEDYFRLLYQLSVPDECAIQNARSHWRFQEVHELFEFIEDNTLPVLVLREKVGDKEHETPAMEVYVAAQRRGFLTREDWRQFQPHILNLARHSIDKAQIDWKVEPAFDKESGLFVWNGIYEGGLNGCGIDFEADIPVERTLL